MKLYVTDLDGTLLNANAQISTEDANRINQILAKKNVTFFTARSISVVKKIFEEVEWKLPCVVNNGAFIYDYNSGKCIDERFIDNEDVRNIIEKAQEMNISYILLCEYQGTERMIYSELNNEGVQTFIDQRRRKNDKRLMSFDNGIQLSDLKVFSIQFVDKYEALKKLHDSIINDNLITYLDREIYIDGYYYLNINSSEATKEKALMRICSLLNVSLSEVTAFGDQVNDLELLKMCGRGIAVSNANPELKQQADLVIGSNIERSVITFLENE